MIRTLCFIILFSYSTGNFAQKQLTNEQVKEDFKIFETILHTAHPALNEYINTYSLDSIFDATKESLSKEDITDIAFFKKLQNVTNSIKDGHLLLFAPNTTSKNQYYFPLVLKIIQSNFYTDTYDYNIPLGSKIISINTKKTDHILEDFKKYAPSDGYNLTRKYRDIELKFGLFYIYEYGISKKFDIEYITPAGEQHSISIPADTFVNVKLKSAKRNSYFSKFHQQKDAVDFYTNYIDKKEPFIYYRDKYKTAVLVVNTFGIETTAFKYKIDKLFQEINKNKTKNLIIDIRSNDGGFRPNAIHLFSYLTSRFFRQQTSTFVTSLKIPEKKYVKRSYTNEKDFLWNKYYEHPIMDGWKLNFDELEILMAPKTNRFKGKIFVLTTGTTFSIGATFALLAKNSTNVLVVGEETGGGYYFRTGSFPVYYEFPNSKIIMVLCMEKINQYTRIKVAPKGSGIIPDRKVELTLDDLIAGRDTQLAYILKLIR